MYTGDNLDDTVPYDEDDSEEENRVNALRHGRNRSCRLRDSAEDDDEVPFHGAVTRGSTDRVPIHFQLPTDSALDYRFLLGLPKSLIFETPEDDLTDPDLSDEQNFISNNYRFVKRKHQKNHEIDICDLYPNKINDLYSWADACQSTDTCLIVCM